MVYLSTMMEAYSDRIKELESDREKTEFTFERMDIDDELSMLKESLEKETMKEFNRLEEMHESGFLDDEQYEVASNGILESYKLVKKSIQPYFMEATEARVSSIVMTEVKAFATVTGAKALAYGINQAIGAVLKKFIISRLSRYTVLNPRVEPFSRFSAKPYDVEEVEGKLNFKSAKKWNEDTGTAVKVTLYVDKNDKPQCAIAVAQKKGAGFVGADKGPRKVETLVLNPQLNKHKDYYAACMSVQKGVFSAAVQRTMQYLSKAWLKEKERLIKGIKESAMEDAKFTEDKIALAQEAYNCDEITKYEFETYADFLESVENEIYTFNEI